MKPDSPPETVARATKSLSYRAATQHILAIEDAMDVTSVLYKDLRVWPFVRLQLWQRLLHPQRFAPPATIGLAHLAQALSQSFFKSEFYLPYVESSRRRQDYLAQLAEHGQVDALFFSRLEDHTERIGWRYCNPHIDAVANLIKTRNTYLKLEFSAEETKQTLPRAEYTHFFDSLEHLKADAQRSLIAAFQDRQELPELVNGQALTELLAGTRFDLALTSEYIMIEAERILHYARYFEELLTVLSPRVVFLTHYHYDIGMALILACRSQGIPSVNLQQNKQGMWHGMYSHWKSVPAEGYGLLPDYFWCWGKSSVEHLVDGMSCPNSNHRALIGGSPWLGSWIHGNMQERASNEAIERYTQALAGEEKVILVTLSSTQFTLPHLVLEAIRSAPMNWRWLIRFHPEQRGQIQQLEDWLQAAALTNVDVEQPSTYPLYSLLPLCHAHITERSTVAYAALRMGIGSIVIDPAGRELFERYIERGHFSRAESTPELLSQLSIPPANLVETTPFVVTDRMYALDALFEVLEKGPVSGVQSPRFGVQSPGSEVGERESEGYEVEISSSS